MEILLKPISGNLLSHCKSASKLKVSQIFSTSAGISWLSAAQLFLFPSRDVWFAAVFWVALLLYWPLSTQPCAAT